MSVLNDKAIYDLKWNYNYNLNRFYKGCEYCNKNPQEMDKWLPEISSILDNINFLLTEIMQNIEVTDEEIEHGFDLKE